MPVFDDPTTNKSIVDLYEKFKDQKFVTYIAKRFILPKPLDVIALELGYEVGIFHRLFVEFPDLELKFKNAVGLKMEQYAEPDQIFTDIYNYALKHNKFNIPSIEVERILSKYAVDISEFNDFLEENTNYGNYIHLDKGFYKLRR